MTFLSSESAGSSHKDVERTTVLGYGLIKTHWYASAAHIPTFLISILHGGFSGQGAVLCRLDAATARRATAQPGFWEALEGMSFPSKLAGDGARSSCTKVAQQSHNGAQMTSSVAVSWTIHTVFCCGVSCWSDSDRQFRTPEKVRRGSSHQCNFDSAWLVRQKHRPLPEVWETCEDVARSVLSTESLFLCMHDHVCLYAYMDAGMHVRKYACMCIIYVSMQAWIVCLSVGWLVLPQSWELIGPTPSALTCVTGEDTPCVFCF